MRRVLPWALVGLVTVAGLGGALVGATNQPSASAQLRLSAIDAATRAAGTARFTYSAITTSTNPLLRSTSYGRGRVDFTTESLSTVEDDRQTSLESSDGGPSLPTTQTNVNSQIWIGNTNYESFNPVGSGSDDSWTKDGSSTVASGLGTFGIFSNVDPISTLAADAAAPGVTMENLGSEMVGTIMTTRFRLTVPTCNVEGAGPLRIAVSPTDLWIDGQDRLVQARSVVSITVPRTFTLPKSITKNFPGYKSLAAPGPFAGQSTTISTVRLFAFGARAAIMAPKTVDSAGSSTGFAISTGSSTGFVFSTHSRKGCRI
jgi:hypothetical protein